MTKPKISVKKEKNSVSSNGTLLDKNSTRRPISRSDIIKQVKSRKDAMTKRHSKLFKPPQLPSLKSLSAYIKKETKQEEPTQQNSGADGDDHDDDNNDCDDVDHEYGIRGSPAKRKVAMQKTVTKKRTPATGVTNPTKRKKDLSKPSNSQHPKVCSGVTTLSAAIDEGQQFDFGRGCASGVRMCASVENQLVALSEKTNNRGDQQVGDAIAELTRDVRMLKTYYEKLQMQYWIESQKFCGNYIARCTHVSLPQSARSQDSGGFPHTHGTPCELNLIIPKPAVALVETFVNLTRPGTKKNASANKRPTGAQQIETTQNVVKRFKDDLVAFP